MATRKTPARKTASATAKPAPQASKTKAAPADKLAPKAAKASKAASSTVAKPTAKPAPAPAKPKKPKLVRDSFTIPKSEYAVLDELKKRAAALTRPAKKSEVLRAGIKALNAMSAVAFLAALDSVPPIKTGRPKLGKPSA